jgi:hypothetical protein
VIESSFWMLNPNEKPIFFTFIYHHIHKWILTRCVKQADVRIFTSNFDREYFLKDDITRTLITPASVIDGDNILSSEEVRQRFINRWGQTLEMILVARLVEEKDVLILIGCN